MVYHDELTNTTNDFNSKAIHYMKRFSLTTLTLFCLCLNLQAQQIPSVHDFKKEMMKNVKEQSKLIAKKEAIQQEIHVLRGKLSHAPTQQALSDLAANKAKVSSLQQELHQVRDHRKILLANLKQRTDGQSEIALQQLDEKATQLNQQITQLKQYQHVIKSTNKKAVTPEMLNQAEKRLGKVNAQLNELKKTHQAYQNKLAHLQQRNLGKEASKLAKQQQADFKEKLIQKTPDQAELLLTERSRLDQQLFLETGAGLILKENIAGHFATVTGFQVSPRLAFGLGGEFRNYLANGENISGLWSGKLMGQFHVTKNWYLRFENYAGIPNISKLQESTPMKKWAWAQMGGLGYSMPAFNGKQIKLELLRTINQQHEAIGEQLYSPYRAQLNFQF